LSIFLMWAGFFWICFILESEGIGLLQCLSTWPDFYFAFADCGWLVTIGRVPGDLWLNSGGLNLSE
jgi:hypothetical protein